MVGTRRAPGSQPGAQNRVRDIRERGYEDEPAYVLGVRASQVRVHDLRNRFALGGDIVGDRVFKARVDLADFRKCLLIIQVDIVD